MLSKEDMSLVELKIKDQYVQKIYVGSNDR